MKKLISSIIVIGATCAATSAQAQFAKPEDAIKYRKAAFTLMAAHNGRLGAMAQGRVPFDAKTATENAEIVADMAKLPWAAFVDGSDSGDTKAKSEIWKDNAKFKDAADKMQAELVKVSAAAKQGNLDALKTAFGPAGATCKNCHDNFRKE
jgi:cytochrome c556